MTQVSADGMMTMKGGVMMVNWACHERQFFTKLRATPWPDVLARAALTGEGARR